MTISKKLLKEFIKSTEDTIMALQNESNENPNCLWYNNQSILKLKGRIEAYKLLLSF